MTEACCQSRRGRETSICGSHGELPGGHLTLQGSPETKTLPDGADRRQRGKSPEHVALRMGQPEEPPRLSSQAPGRLPRRGTSLLKYVLVPPRSIQACRNGNCCAPDREGKTRAFSSLLAILSAEINPGADRWGDQAPSPCTQRERFHLHVPRRAPPAARLAPRASPRH